MKTEKTMTLWITKKDMLDWAKFKLPKERIKCLGDCAEIDQDGGYFEIKIE